MSTEGLRIPSALQQIDGIHETIERICAETELAREKIEQVLRRLESHGLLRRDTAYNGWKNYEAWSLYTWLTSDEGNYVYCRELARECAEDASTCPQVIGGTWSEFDARRILLADRLKDHVDNENPLIDEASLFSDLLGAALQEVDWHELADALLADVS